MTTHEEHVVAAEDAATGPATTSVTDLGDAAAAADSGVICQAESVEIGIGQDGADPFDAIFLLAGTDPRGREVAVWIRLTPTTINDLTDQLTQVLVAQQQILGGNGFHRTTDDVGSVNLIWPHDDGLIWPRESEVSRGGARSGDRGPGRLIHPRHPRRGGTGAANP